MSLVLIRSRKAYWLRLLIAFDQFFNVLLSPLLNRFLPANHKEAMRPLFGFEDETLSSVFGKNARYVKWCYWMCQVLSRFDSNHCEKSIERDEG